MASLNKNSYNNLRTHEGSKATPMNKKQALERSVMSCMLWEKSFYEEGEDIATRINKLAQSVPKEFVFELAKKAKQKGNLRHAPMWLTMARIRDAKKDDILPVINRVDDITEILSMYWADGKKPISKQLKLALAESFNKFDEYQFGKYNRKKDVKIKDVLKLVHPVPKDKEQSEIFKRILNDELKTPDTWEVALSSGKDKKETFSRLLAENKLGGLALLRNLRNMIESGVDKKLITEGIKNIRSKKILPYTFYAAAKHAPQLEPNIEQAMLKCLEEKPKLKGRTILLIDVSGSMFFSGVSGKSDLSRADAACALATLTREICDEIEVFSFSNSLALIAPRRGFALRDAIINSQYHGRTQMYEAIKVLNEKVLNENDRLIVFTDEQTSGKIVLPKSKNNYMINVESYQNGISYGGWKHIDGFSASVIDWILEYEN